LCVTTEFHHGDIVWRCLAEPSRGVLVAAKAGACALTGALLGLLAVQVGILIEVGFGSPGATFGLTSTEALQAVAGSVLGAAMAGVLGVGIGAAARNQTAAVVGTLVAVLLVEPVLTSLAPHVGAFLPSAAAAAAAGHAAAMGATAGLVLTAAYAALAVGVGGVLCARRDV
jgi:ABC-2 type transport system permease protein